MEKSNASYICWNGLKLSKNVHEEHIPIARGAGTGLPYVKGEEVNDKIQPKNT